MNLHGFGTLLLEGTWLTVRLALASMTVAIALGLLAALAGRSRVAALRLLANVYATLVRGIPELLMLLV